MRKRRFPYGSFFSIFLHVTWAILVAFMLLANWHYIKYYPWTVQSDPSDPVMALPAYGRVLVDPVNAAGQLGRLDLVSIGLTVLGAVIAVAATLGFWMVRREAVEAAESEARSEVERLCPKAIAAYFEGQDGRSALKALFETNPTLLYFAAERATVAMAGGVQKSEADSIAAAMELDNDNGS